MCHGKTAHSPDNQCQDEECPSQPSQTQHFEEAFIYLAVWHTGTPWWSGDTEQAHAVVSTVHQRNLFSGFETICSSSKGRQKRWAAISVAPRDQVLMPMSETGQGGRSVLHVFVCRVPLWRKPMWALVKYENSTKKGPWDHPQAWGEHMPGSWTFLLWSGSAKHHANLIDLFSTSNIKRMCVIKRERNQRITWLKILHTQLCLDKPLKWWIIVGGVQRVHRFERSESPKSKSRQHGTGVFCVIGTVRPPCQQIRRWPSCLLTDAQ